MKHNYRFTTAFINEMHVETIHMAVVRSKRVGASECFALDFIVFHMPIC